MIGATPQATLDDWTAQSILFRVQSCVGDEGMEPQEAILNEAKLGWLKWQVERGYFNDDLHAEGPRWPVDKDLFGQPMPAPAEPFPPA